MTSKTFVSGTVIDSAWLNDVNDATYEGTAVYTPAGTGAVATTIQNKLQEIVSVKDFGAAGDGVTDDSLAITSASATGKTVYFPNGTYVFTSLVINTICKGFVGESRDGVILFPARTTRTANDNIISYTGATGFVLDKMSFDVQNAEFADTYLLRIDSASAVRLKNLKVSGAATYGIYITDSFDVSVDDVVAVGNTGGFNTFTFSLSGTQANYKIHFSRISVSGTHASAAAHNGGTDCSITGCRSVNATGSAFAFGLNKCYQSYIANNYAKDSQYESFQLTDCRYCTISGNHGEWTTSGQDFGISIDGTNVGGFTARFNKVFGNTLLNSYKSGIAVANFSQYNVVYGNVLYDCAVRFVSCPLVCYTSDYAGATSNGNVFHDNTCINEAGGIVNYVQESQGSGMTTTDNEYNWNKFSGTISGTRYSLVSGNTSRYHDLEWVTWSPTISSSSGTLTSYTINSARYKVHGKEVIVQIDVTITNVGTGAGSIVVTLPLTADTNGGSLCGREANISGHAFSGNISGTIVPLTKYDNSFPASTGARLIASGVYRAA